jgi:N-acylneuraminate cytidylyltransferase
VEGLALDFDGVLTDNTVVTYADGGETVVCDRSDGLGIEMLRRAGLPMIVLSKEAHGVVAARCQKLGLDLVQGLEDKVGALARWVTENDLDATRIVFVGNDVNDIECLEYAGCGVAVGDAYAAAKAHADLVLTRPGGHGAVRELADLLLARGVRATCPRS